MPESARQAGFHADYLAAKASIDSRSLHPRVWMTFTLTCQKIKGPFRLLDLGAGTGSMLPRLVEQAGLAGFQYTALDADAALLAELRESRHEAAAAARVQISTVCATLERFLDLEAPGGFDVIVSHAFLDLVDIPRVLGPLLGLLKPGGVFYFSQVFDGVTSFLPIDPDDDDVMRRYHASMLRPAAGGGSAGAQAGRRLVQSLLEEGGPARVLIHDLGPSDWVVLPRANGYQVDEKILLSSMLGFIEDSLEAGSATGWLERRRCELDQGRLGLLTHQWDAMGSLE